MTSHKETLKDNPISFLAYHAINRDHIHYMSALATILLGGYPESKFLKQLNLCISL